MTAANLCIISCRTHDVTGCIKPDDFHQRRCRKYHGSAPPILNAPPRSRPKRKRIDADPVDSGLSPLVISISFAISQLSIGKRSFIRGASSSTTRLSVCSFDPRSAATEVELLPAGRSIAEARVHTWSEQI